MYASNHVIILHVELTSCKVVRERHRKLTRITNALVAYPAVRCYHARLNRPQARSMTWRNMRR